MRGHGPAKGGDGERKRGQSPRSGVLASIHILKSSLGVSDEDYRYCLKEWTGKSSCKDMSLTELKEAAVRLRELKARCEGAEAPASAFTRKKQADADDYPPGCSRPQWRKIRWLQRELRWNDTNLRGYVKHQTGLDHERFLDVPSARKVITGLVKVLRNEEKSRSGEASPRKRAAFPSRRKIDG